MPATRVIPRPPDGGVLDKGLQQNWGGQQAIRQRVRLPANGAFAALSIPLPPYARIIKSGMRLATGAVLDMLATDTTAAAATGVLAMTIIAPTSLVTNSTTSHFFKGSSASDQNTVTVATPEGVSAAEAARDNNGSNAATIYVLPYADTTAAGGAARFNVNTTTPTSGYTFGTSNVDVDVHIVMETFNVPPAV